jgi:hypothetical protein
MDLSTPLDEVSLLISILLQLVQSALDLVYTLLIGREDESPHHYRTAIGDLVYSQRLKEAITRVHCVPGLI